MSVSSRRVLSLLLLVCGIALMLRPAAALSSSPKVLINEFMPRPSSGNPEWVELFNPNPVPIDISGWKIYKDAKNGFSFRYPPNLTVQRKGSTVRLYHFIKYANQE